MTGPATYPLHLDLRDRRVLVVGGGPVSARRARGLLDAGADVVLVAPGAIRSNISATQASHFELPQDSLYKDYIGQIMRRISSSQGRNSMDTDEFARAVVRENVPADEVLELPLSHRP